MPYSPATPSKSAEDSPLGSSRVALQSAEKPTSTSKAKQSAVFEPSPASTYGDTAAGDSSPATPFESGKHGKSSTLQHPSVYLSTSLPLTLLPPTDLALLPCPSCFSIFFPFYLSISSSLHLSTSPRMHPPPLHLIIGLHLQLSLHLLSTLLCITSFLALVPTSSLSSTSIAHSPRLRQPSLRCCPHAKALLSSRPPLVKMLNDIQQLPYLTICMCFEQVQC